MANTNNNAPVTQQPANNAEFLKKSGWVFNIIGIIAFVAGLIVGSPAIWITGCAAVTSGCYCLVKGRQQAKENS